MPDDTRPESHAEHSISWTNPDGSEGSASLLLFGAGGAVLAVLSAVAMPTGIGTSDEGALALLARRLRLIAGEAERIAGPRVLPCVVHERGNGRFHRQRVVLLEADPNEGRLCLATEATRTDALGSPYWGRCRDVQRAGLLQDFALDLYSGAPRLTAGVIVAAVSADRELLQEVMALVSARPDLMRQAMEVAGSETE